MSRSSLIPFHRVLITAGIVFCAGFGVWTFVAASRARDGGWLWVLGSVFVVLAVALAVYLYNLNRILGLSEDE